MTTTPIENLTLSPENYPPSDLWEITVDSDDPILRNLTLIQLSDCEYQSGNLNNLYTTFGGMISETLLGTTPASATINGVYIKRLIILSFSNSTDTYVFTGLCTNNAEGAIVINGTIYKNDPTEDGSWSATAQGTTTPPKTSAAELVSTGVGAENNAQGPTASVAPA